MLASLDPSGPFSPWAAGLGEDVFWGEAAVHEVFGELFLRFVRDIWEVERPPSGGMGVMAFPALFKRLVPQCCRRNIESWLTFRPLILPSSHPWQRQVQRAGDRGAKERRTVTGRECYLHPRK